MVVRYIKDSKKIFQTWEEAPACCAHAVRGIQTQYLLPHIYLSCYLI